MDAVNAGVGRLLQQLHDRQIALNEMSLSSQVGLCVVVPSLFLSCLLYLILSLVPRLVLLFLLLIECFKKGVKFLSHMLPYMPFKDLC